MLKMNDKLHHCLILDDTHPTIVEALDLHELEEVHLFQADLEEQILERLPMTRKEIIRRLRARYKRFLAVGRPYSRQYVKQAFRLLAARESEQKVLTLVIRVRSTIF
jgi:hypothetical protein